MSIADIFESGEKKQHKGHFRNLIMIAKADGVVSVEESDLLKKIASHIGLSPSDVDDVIANPDKYDINPPVSLEDRYRRLVNLVEMVNADQVFEDEEIGLLQRYGVGLGFNDDQILNAVDATVNGLEDGLTEDDIVESLLKG